MSQTLNKLLTIAVSDPDIKVRGIMLNSLKNNFNSYLKKRSNLQRLILSLNDSSDEVQQKTIIILKQLIPNNPSEIVPALQKVLFKLIRVINLDSIDTHKGILKNLKLLRCYIKHASFLLENQKDLVFGFLLSIIKNQNTTPLMTAEIFSTLRALISISQEASIKYFDDLMKILVDNLQDMAFKQKRVEAVRCLSTLVCTSGLVVYVNYRYCQLNDLLFLLFQLEPHPEVRIELMRLMGHLGAIDYFNLFRLKSGDNSNKLSKMHRNELMNIIKISHKSKFHFEKVLAESSRKGGNPGEIKLKSFFENVLNLNQIVSTNYEEKSNVLPIYALTEHKSSLEDKQTILNQEVEILDENIQELLRYPNFINLSNIDTLLEYITDVTVKALLLKLFDETLIHNHKDIIDTLYSIVYSIEEGISPYLHIIVPCLSHYFLKYSNKSRSHTKILKLFENILMKCGASFGSVDQNNINLLLGIVLKILNESTDRDTIMKCLDTLIELIESNKHLLKYKMEKVALKLLNLLLSGTEKKESIQKIFKILKSLKEFNENFLHLVLPSFCQFINEYQGSGNEYFVKEIIKYIEAMLEYQPIIQFSSLIVHSFIECIDVCDELREDCKNCLIKMIYKLKNHILFYIPLINSCFKKRGLDNDPDYKRIIENLKNYGNLENLEDIKDSQAFLNDSGIRGANTISSSNPLQESDTKNHREFIPHAIRNFSSEEVKNLFDVSGNYMKEEWEEWITKTSTELLIKSPSTVLSSCKTFTNVNPTISRELFNVAFAIIWSQFNDNQKTSVIQNIEKTILFPNVPITVLKVILNLAEFMEHDSQGLQLDISCMANLAEKVNAHAKALYYREFEFHYCPENTIESLLSLYSNLGQPEAADGMLIFAKRMLKTQVKSGWLESLGRWRESLEEYSKIEKIEGKNNSLEMFNSKVKCYSNLANWEVVVEKVEEAIVNETHISDIAHYAAKAALQLGEWDKMEIFAESIDPKKEDPNFYNAILSISKEKYEAAEQFIYKCRVNIENFLVGISSQNYHNSYDRFVRLMALSEMEEIINFKKFSQELDKENMLGNISFGGREEGSLYLKKQQQLLQLWSDRIEGVEKEQHTWTDILGVRSLLFSKSEMMSSYLRFAKWGLKKQWPAVGDRIFKALREDLNKTIASKLQKEAELMKDSFSERINAEELLEDAQYPFPPIFYLSYYEYQYKQEEIGIKEVYQKIRHFFECIECENTIQATYNRKVGSWMSEDEITAVDYETITGLFKTSLELNPEVVKTWHLFALANYKRVKDITESNLNENKRYSFEQIMGEGQIKEHISDAFKGFIKSISIGGPDCSETLQDTLRLLDLWFRYGELGGIQKLIKDCFNEINLECWLPVIPQMITKLDINSQLIRANIVELLSKIGDRYPQGLIFQLFVANHSSDSLRKKEANKIIIKLQRSNAKIVEHTKIISQELNKVAILFEEEWYDILDAIFDAFVKMEFEKVYKVMSNMHSKIKKEPKSQNEVWFFQKYEHLIMKADYYLSKYNVMKDPLPMFQALEIYIKMHDMMKTSIGGMVKIHLKNISPKLMMLKNTSVAVPGLFNPRRELILISSLSGVLKLIRSKRRPRILRMFGSDGKSYDFLLKGGEDMRQDERVMQLLTLVNTLLEKDDVTEKKDLTIITYPVIPLSMQAGLLGWVQNCDTLHQLIRDYRTSNFIMVEAERNMQKQLCENYQDLPIPNKVEIFRYIMENSKGEDLQKVLWLKSQNAEEWLRKRTNFTRSLATMSMVGYILGLGDRHLSNLMMQRFSGKMVHIDFGDCFEVAMLRDKYPEKIPFRLTRVLVKAMEACGIEGNYRFTCENVLRVIRENRESLIAILEAFVWDPLINWRWLSGDGGHIEAAHPQSKQGGAPTSFPTQPQIESLAPAEEEVMEDVNINLKSLKTKREDIGDEMEDSYVGDGKLERKFKQMFGEQNAAGFVYDKKALAAMNRIKAKLSGKDFKNTDPLSYKEQVEKLIMQATSHENICQGYLGWNPFL